MALFRDLGVNLRARLCGVLKYASAQALDVLDLAENCSPRAWKPRSSHPDFRDGNYPESLTAWGTLDDIDVEAAREEFQPGLEQGEQEVERARDDDGDAYPAWSASPSCAFG